MRRLLRILALGTFLIAVSIAAVQPSLASDIRYFYWQKDADGNNVVELLNENLLFPIVLSAGAYYNFRKLGTNAVLCGKRVDRAALEKYVRLLIRKGVQLQYIGPFYKPEFNSFKDTIDTRSVGTREFYGNVPVIDEDYLDAEWTEEDWNKPELCGYQDKSVAEGFDLTEFVRGARQIEVKYSETHNLEIVDALHSAVEKFSVNVERVQGEGSEGQIKAFSGKVWYYYEDDALLAQKIAQYLESIGYDISPQYYEDPKLSLSLPIRVWVPLSD